MAEFDLDYSKITNSDIWRGLNLTEQQYNSGNYDPTQFAKFAQANRIGVSTNILPDVTPAIQSGRIVDVGAQDLARSLGVYGKETRQALFIHPITKQWVTPDQLPKGPSGKLQAIGQNDGNPFVNRSGSIEIAQMPEPSQWMKLRDRFIKPIALPMAALGTGAYLGAGALGATGASAAGAGSTLPELGAGIFTGGAEAAATGGSGVLGFGGIAGGAAPTAGFAVPTLGAGAQVATPSGIMSWLGSPTGRAAMDIGRAGLEAFSSQRAAGQQAGAAQAGIEEQRRQFESTRAALSPFLQAGTQSLGGFAPYQQAGLQAFGQQQALAGLQGAESQRAAINQLAASPEFQALAQQGESAMLQNAAATGGLRGGNVQAALAQFRPAMLQRLIDQQLSRLGGFAGTGLAATQNLASMGQSAAAQQGQFGGVQAANIGNLLGQIGQAQAGGTIGMARGIAQGLNVPARILGQQQAQQQTGYGVM